MNISPVLSIFQLRAETDFRQEALNLRQEGCILVLVFPWSFGWEEKANSG